MTFSNASNQETNSGSVEPLAAWKEKVQHFFSSDWSRLRTLMMELEEEAWNMGMMSQRFWRNHQTGLDTDGRVHPSFRTFSRIAA